MSDQSPNSRCKRVASVALFVLALGLVITAGIWRGTKSQPQLLQVTLIVGINFCLALAFAVQLAIVAARYSHSLNREIVSRTDAEEELTWAREQLAAQVRRRAEFQGIVTLLLHEVEEHRRAEDCLRQLNSCLLRLQDEELRWFAQASFRETRPRLMNLGIDIGNLSTTSLDAQLT